MYEKNIDGLPLGLQPKHVSLPGIKLATIWFADQHSIHEPCHSGLTTNLKIGRPLHISAHSLKYLL